MTTTPAMCVVRIKRKREDDPVDSLIIQKQSRIDASTDSFTPLESILFKLDYSTSNLDDNASILKHTRPSVTTPKLAPARIARTNRVNQSLYDGKTARYRLVSQNRLVGQGDDAVQVLDVEREMSTTDELPEGVRALILDYVGQAALEPLPQAHPLLDPLQTNQQESDEFVYDFYSLNTTRPPITTTQSSIPSITNPPLVTHSIHVTFPDTIFDDLRDAALSRVVDNSDDDDEEMDEADEDSNCEDDYRNDYPEEEDWEGDEDGMEDGDYDY